MRARFSVPATSANLGPGFDSFGIALKLYNKFEAELADEWVVEVEGEGEEYLLGDADNQVALAMRYVFEHAGCPAYAAHIWCTNRVPTGNGLGSSSTAIVGGALLARELLATHDNITISDEELFQITAHLEGHSDNVAPALFGGFTVCWTDEQGAQYARFEPERGLAAVVVPSLGELSTAKSRELLPSDVSHKDAAFNVAHAGLLAAAMISGRIELLGEALKDRLHQPYRAAAISDLDQISDILRDAGCHGVALSGAGPTVIGLVAADTDEEAYEMAVRAAAAAADAARALGTRREPLPLAFDRNGARAF